MRATLSLSLFLTCFYCTSTVITANHTLKALLFRKLTYLMGFIANSTVNATKLTGKDIVP